jgi:hypothetical protein
MNALMCFNCGRECAAHQQHTTPCCEDPRVKEVEDIIRSPSGRLIDVREIAYAASKR